MTLAPAHAILAYAREMVYTCNPWFDD